MATIADVSVSLDGYVTAPGAELEHGLGIDGEPLHNWVFNGDDVDDPHGWSDEMGYGAQHAASPPFFVVTHRGRPDHLRLPHELTFVPDPKSAVDAARAAARSKDVVVMGGGSIIRQCVLDGLLDELTLHVSPIVFGGGTPMFVDADRVELRQTSVRA